MSESKKSSKKKQASPVEKATEEIVNAILSSPIEPTAENIGISKAVQTLRISDIKTDPTTELKFKTLVRKYQEKMLRELVTEIVEAENIRVIDITSIMEAISISFALLPLWDYRHIGQVDDIIMKYDEEEDDRPAELKKINNARAKSMFKGLADSYAEEEDEEGDE